MESTGASGGDTAAPFGRIAIVGFGLIGASIALAARRRWPSVRLIAIDRKPVIQTAVASGIADAAGDDLAIAADADLVVLAAPVCANIGILAELPQHIAGDAVVTDVGSTKRAIAEGALSLPSRFTFVGGHPLAGAAIGGLDAARADLFAGRPWILTPPPNADGEPAVERLRSFVQSLGARVRVMTPEAHDALVAYLSHLPQLAASALMHLVGERAGVDGLALAGPGLSDTTRLASSPSDIWRDITATNRDNIAQAIDELVEILLRLKSDTRAGGESLAAVFASAANWKRSLDARRDPS